MVPIEVGILIAPNIDLQGSRVVRVAAGDTVL